VIIIIIIYYYCYYYAELESTEGVQTSGKVYVCDLCVSVIEIVIISLFVMQLSQLCISVVRLSLLVMRCL